MTILSKQHPAISIRGQLVEGSEKECEPHWAAVGAPYRVVGFDAWWRVQPGTVGRVALESVEPHLELHQLSLQLGALPEPVQLHKAQAETAGGQCEQCQHPSERAARPAGGAGALRRRRRRLCRLHSHPLQAGRLLGRRVCSRSERHGRDVRPAGPCERD